MTSFPRPQTPTDVDTPGLKWRKRKHGWEARWIARHDAAKRGFEITVRRMWPSQEGTWPAAPTPEEWADISIKTRALQDEMLAWLHVGAANSGDPAKMFDDTFG